MGESGIARLGVAALLAIFAFAGSTVADTIYLKNGRVIRTSSAMIDGDRVLFTQFGHPIAIPLSEVERVEEDEYDDPAATPTPEPPASLPTSSQVAPSGATSSATSAADQPPDPEASKDYWQNRARGINAEAEALKLELQQLRRIERAFLFSHRSTADTRRQIDDVEARTAANERALPELRREARRKGIPPGWLRLPRGG